MLEAHVGVEEEVIELILECSKQGLRDLILDRGRELIVETELFDNEIEIINEGVLDEFFDWVIQLIRDLLFFVTVFKPQEPQI